MTDEIKSSILETIEAYKRRWALPADPPGPLIVPDWLPAAWAHEHPDDDLDKIARDYGFDGYKTVSES